MKSNNPFNILAARGEGVGVCVGMRDGPWASQHIMEMSWACQGWRAAVRVSAHHGDGAALIGQEGTARAAAATAHQT